MRLIILAAVLLAAGCTPPPEPTTERLAAFGLTQGDWHQCKYEAAVAGQGVRGGALYQGASEKHFLDLCLEARMAAAH